MTQLKFVLVFALTFIIGQWFSNAGSVGVYALVTVPGTFMHELMHWVAAALTQGDPHGLSVIPTSSSLGHVLVRPNWYNATMIALAPLLLAPLTLFVMVIAARSSVMKMLLFSYFAACCWAACIPSNQDFAIALSFPTSWLFGVIMVALIGWATFSTSIYLLKRTQ